MYFFIGTEAELIKIFPVIMKCQRKGGICNIIASGQNDLKKNRILDYINLNGKYVELSKETDIKKSAVGLLRWFFVTKRKAKSIIAKNFDIANLKNSLMIVHGDTISTFMGALIGRQLHMKICHVEAGLRSHHLLNPFPEEIDRLLTSRLARMHFAPGKEAAANLVRAKGQVIDTQYNTIIDSLEISRIMPPVTEALNNIFENQYFVFVMHRQENLINKEFVDQVVKQIRIMAKQMKCVLILHKITENVLQEMNLLKQLKTDSDFVLLPRVDYFDFMKILDQAEYVITDGGSNQEELYYMGKPCLIMRKTTERKDGIGQNAKMFEGNMKELLQFADEYTKLRIKPIRVEGSPAEIIANQLVRYSC